MTRRHYARIILALVLLVGCLTVMPVGAMSYAIVKLPDNQYLASTYPDLENYTYSYIQSIKPTYNISLIINTGDIVDNPNRAYQWQNWKNARTYTTIPELDVAGNHDLVDYYEGNGLPNYTNFSVNTAATLSGGAINWTYVYQNFVFLGIGWSNGATTSACPNSTLDAADVTAFNTAQASNPTLIPWFLVHWYMEPGGSYSNAYLDQQIQQTMILRPSLISSGHVGNTDRTQNTIWNNTPVVESVYNQQLNGTPQGNYSGFQLWQVTVVGGVVTTINETTFQIYPTNVTWPTVTYYTGGGDSTIFGILIECHPKPDCCILWYISDE